LRDLVNKFAHVRFEPSGFTGNSEIPIAKSIVDYIFRWLGARFLAADDKAGLGLQGAAASYVAEAPAPFAAPVATATAPGAPSEGESTGEDVEADAGSAGSAGSGGAGGATGVATESHALPVVEPSAKAGGNGNGLAGGNGNGRAAVSASLGTRSVAFTVQEDAPSCAECGSIMVRNGSCYKCMNCGSTSGCS
ncbi:MAG: vitamin B12-dependent ribonucleotide reductase, partial [Chloroflexi bacterium]|nr:vitamin B12-dependent ribonucleotide reductase [Chloroflexota bacterium]